MRGIAQVRGGGGKGRGSWISLCSAGQKKRGGWLETTLTVEEKIKEAIVPILAA